MVTSISNYLLANDEWFESFEALSKSEQALYLFLAPHDRFTERLSVEGIDGSWILDLEGLVGRYRTVHISKLDQFLVDAESAGYKVIFLEDPQEQIEAWVARKTALPRFSLNSSLPGAMAGMLPRQLEEFNKLKTMARGGLMVWDAGVGKTAGMAAMIKEKIEVEGFDLALVVCKKNNKIDTQRKLLALGDIDYTYVFDGKASKGKTVTQAREEMYLDALERLDSGLPVVGILNYEKFRQDPDNEYLIKMVSDRRVLVILDEAPTRLSNRGTALYKSYASVMYGREIDKKTKKPKKALSVGNVRAKELVQICSTATPVEKSPVGVLNMVRLIDPLRFPLITEWEKAHVAKKDPFTKEPVAFKNLDLMSLVLEDITSRISKDDPSLAHLFPKHVQERIDLELSEQDRSLYDRMIEVAIQLLEDPYAEEEISPLQLISVAQLICCAPSLITLSASRREAFEALVADLGPEDAAPAVTGSQAAKILVENLGQEEINDHHCEKLYALKSVFDTFHEDKVIVFSSLAGYIQPVLKQAFDEWGIRYEVYAGTDKQCQEAKDRFRGDPSIMVLLLSDKGSDGIDLPEAAIGVNYDLPWKWSTKVQRRNRNNRVDSKLDLNIWIDLVYRDTVEERKEEILMKKRGYHEDLFDGASDASARSGLTRGEMLYILKGSDG